MKRGLQGRARTRGRAAGDFVGDGGGVGSKLAVAIGGDDGGGASSELAVAVDGDGDGEVDDGGSLGRGQSGSSSCSSVPGIALSFLFLLLLRTDFRPLKLF